MEDEISACIVSMKCAHRRVVANLLTDDAEVAVLKLIGFAEQGVEGFAWRKR